MATALFRSSLQAPQLLSFYRSVREMSQSLSARLSDADATVQSMQDASPAKWHLAHTTWFFETIVLVPYLTGYRCFDATFNFLFNSYYNSIGARLPRPKRGLITRPSLDEVYNYREHVDAGMMQLLAADALPEAAAQLVELGCHHEQQHQELLLTDILHLFAQNPRIRPTKTRSHFPLKPTRRILLDSKLCWAAFRKSATRAKSFRSIAKGHRTKSLSNHSDWRIGLSRIENGWNSSLMAGIGTRCFGYPMAGRRLNPKDGRRRFIGKSVTINIGQ